MRHAGHEAHEIATYATWDGTSFDLNYDSCLCKPCYQDYKRNYHNRENVMPPWAKKKHEYYDQLHNTDFQHCLLCCVQDTEGSTCQCSQIVQWGPEQWQGMDAQSSWKKFLCVNGHADPTVAERSNHICRAHYRRIADIRARRSCQICATKHNDLPWKLVLEVSNNPDSLCEAFSLPEGSVNLFDWICNRCELCHNNIHSFCTRLEQDISSADIATAARANVIQNTLEKLRTLGIVFTREVQAEFKLLLQQAEIEPHTKIMNSFTKYIDNAVKKHRYCTYLFPTSTKAVGKVIYNDNIFNPASIAYVSSLKAAAWKAQTEIEALRDALSSCMTPQKLRELIKEQVSMFPVSSTFDYRGLSAGGTIVNETKLDSYFNTELIDFLDQATISEHSL